MKRLWLLLVAILLVCPLAFCETTATIGGMDSSGNYHWSADHDGTLTGNSNAELELGDVELAEWTTVINLPLSDFYQTGNNAQSGGGGSTSYIAPLTESTNPNRDIQNRVNCLVWDDGDTSYAQVTFKVPQDYVSGGLFKVFVDTDTGTVPGVQWRVLVNTDGSAWDTTVTAQTEALSGGTAGTPELVTLTTVTDFASLAANDVVSFLITRDNAPSSITGDLELYYVDFYYNE